MDANVSVQQAIDNINRKYSEVCGRIGKTYCERLAAERQLKAAGDALTNLLAEHEALLAEYAQVMRLPPHAKAEDNV